MITRVLWALGIFGVFVFHVGNYEWTPFGLFVVCLLGIGIPIAIIGNPICEHFYKVWKTRMICGSVRQTVMGENNIYKEARKAEAIRRKTATASSSYQNPYASYEDLQSTDSSSILTAAQIEQLHKLRDRATVGMLKRFPYVRISGSSMKNVMLDAGAFTAQIRKKGSNEVTNTVVLVPSRILCASFRSAYMDIGNCEFQAEGYLLPSRTGDCYAVLLLVVFNLGGYPVIWKTSHDA